MLESALERSGYLAELQAEHTVEAEGRLENLAELIGFAREFEAVDEFLEQVSLVADTDELPDADSGSVVLMTMHAAKGLEFPNVFILGMEDGVFPHLRALGEPAELEEERRLCYVGITRARAAALPHATRGAARCSARRSTTRRAGSSTRSPAELLQVAEGSRDQRGAAAAAAATGAGRARVDARAWAATASSTPPSRAGQQPSRRAAPAPTQLGLRAGDDVRHAKWGEGVILDIIGVGREGRGRRPVPVGRREAPAPVLGAAQKV